MPKSLRSGNRTVLLAERIEHLSTKRQEIIRPILEHPREYVLLSVRALAKRLHTDPATIVRIVHGLGFENYKQFQRHLHELSLAFATSLDTMRQGESDRGTGSPAGDSVLYDLKNLQGFKNSLDPKRYKQLAKRIHEARRVVILAGDLATVLADYLGYQLSLLGLPIHVASSPGAIAHTVFLLTKQDLVIAISFRRGLRSTIEGVQQARERGAYCVGVADTYISAASAEMPRSVSRFHQFRVLRRVLHCSHCPGQRDSDRGGRIQPLTHHGNRPGARGGAAARLRWYTS